MKFISHLSLAILLCACSAGTSQKADKQKSIVKPYPFELKNINDQLIITAAIESEELFNKYNSSFSKHGYNGNGYCWEGHIIQILENLDRGLLDHIDFDPEAGAFFAYPDSEEAQMKFIKTLSPIFCDLEMLDQYIKAADRKRVDD